MPPTTSLYAQWTQLFFHNQTDDTYYATLQEAVNAASAGDVIVVLAGGSYPGGVVINTNGVTINLNGATFGPGSPFLTVNAANTTVNGPGTVDGLTGGLNSTFPAFLVNAGGDNFILDGVEMRWADGVRSPAA